MGILFGFMTGITIYRCFFCCNYCHFSISFCWELLYSVKLVLHLKLLKLTFEKKSDKKIFNRYILESLFKGNITHGSHIQQYLAYNYINTSEPQKLAVKSCYMFLIRLHIYFSTLSLSCSEHLYSKLLAMKHDMVIILY